MNLSHPRYLIARAFLVFIALGLHLIILVPCLGMLSYNHLSLPFGPLWALACWTQFLTSALTTAALLRSTRRPIYPLLRRATMALSVLGAAIGILWARDAVSFDFRGFPVVYFCIIPILAPIAGFAALFLRPPVTAESLSSCESCGYDLRGSLQTQRCPECDRSFDPATIVLNLPPALTWADVWKHRLRWLPVLIVLAALFLSWTLWTQIAQHQIRARYVLLHQAIMAGDINTARTLVSARYRREYNDMNDMNDMNGLTSEWSLYGVPADGGCSVFGSSATLYTSSNPFGSGDLLRWVREDGEWRLDEAGFIGND